MPFNIWDVFNSLWRIFIDYPTGMVMLFGALGGIAMLTTEFVIRREKRSDLRQQMMYERQETVFYVSLRDKTLLRPAQIPAADPGELLRGAESAVGDANTN